MTSVFMVALLYMNGEWTMVKAFPPIVTPSMEFCLDRATVAQKNLDDRKLRYKAHVACLETTVEEGDQAIKDYVAKNLREKL